MPNISATNCAPIKLLAPTEYKLSVAGFCHPTLASVIAVLIAYVPVLL